ncbi:EAL and HDOD domain-containing protein [Massilia sp. erpn]|uniref:EAL and HDOD domain-containing protein n=1 Tax=Massilia sp. erpn TaxID=2738142 RepID=UPI0021067580|nr:HDOD domain-containing protein [Massilia sp. erpn]UTY60427.1 HDOD domain-containing protein [Massilia sp. erpn]
MSASDSSTFPLVGLQAVSNAQHQWVALAFHLTPQAGLAAPALAQLFAYPDMRAALAPLDFIVSLDDPLHVDEALATSLPAQHTILRVPAAACAKSEVQNRCRELSERGFRLMVDGEAGLDAGKAGMRALSADAGGGLPSMVSILTLAGPHWASNVADKACLENWRSAGFSWFSGAYTREGVPEAPNGDGTSRKRLLALLGLLARDADSRELEILLKQDPALAYHLLKLVNSAAFAPAAPIHSFTQAINVLGRRQLQRWLQLLLYARQQDEGGANALLPLAAVRGAQMEFLCKERGGDRDAQDMAFVAGVFSLLDVLLGMPMTEIVSALSLDLDVVRALLDRAGPLGDMLGLTEAEHPDPARLQALGIDTETHWRGLLQAYHWAIQVSRNL